VAEGTASWRWPFKGEMMVRKAAALAASMI
jgi:hypothetical protein